jgi:O-methyltransferase domain
MKPDGRLLIVETVLPTGDTPHQGKMQDMVMLVVPGAQERTEAEYAMLLDKAGFRLSRVVSTESVASVVEAVPAERLCASKAGQPRSLDDECANSSPAHRHTRF